MNIEFLNGIGTNVYTQANPIPKIEKVSEEFQNKVLQQYISIEKERNSNEKFRIYLPQFPPDLLEVLP